MRAAFARTHAGQRRDGERELRSQFRSRGTEERRRLIHRRHPRERTARQTASRRRCTLAAFALWSPAASRRREGEAEEEAEVVAERNREFSRAEHAAFHDSLFHELLETNMDTLVAPASVSMANVTPTNFWSPRSDYAQPH